MMGRCRGYRNTPATQAIISQSLILKMLKSNLTNVKNRFGT
jgi:hypothetical protein